MKKRIFVIVLMAILNASSFFVYAQNSSKKPEKVFPCGCIITSIEYRCGLCGRTLEADLKTLKYHKGYRTCNYICRSNHDDSINPSPHVHENVSDEFDYVHKCIEGKCLEISKVKNEIGEIEWYFKNTCKVRKYYSLTISYDNKNVVISMLRPDQIAKSPASIPESANLIINITHREGFDILNDF